MDVKNDFNFLEKEFNENKYSHIFLIETNNLVKCEEELKKKIKAIIKADDITSKQIDNEEFIDLIIVRSDGKSIKKNQIAELQVRLKVKPVISEKLIYIITPADTLNEIASNKLLKTIEEPNDNVLGFLITNNLSQILSTIRSRCEQLTANYKCDNSIALYNNEYIEETKKIIEIIETGSMIDLSLLMLESNAIEKYSKEIANTIKDYYNIASRAVKQDNYDKNIVNIIIKNNTSKDIIKKAMYLNKLMNKLNVNMNGELMLYKIFIDLKEVKM